jgi:hypothetical protein
MNVTFLVGNGFDLNVGLNTRFRDVLKFYLKEKNTLPQTGNVLVNASQIVTKEFTTDQRIKKFKEDIRNDFENWSDFEKHIGHYTKKYSNVNVDDFCFCIKNFKEALVEYLKNEEKRIDYELHKDNIVKILNKSIINFYDGLNIVSKELFRGIIKNEAISGNPMSCNFITFNYTNVLNDCLKIVKSSNLNFRIGEILHIHGDILKNVLIGVDNQEQIENKELATNKQINWNIVKPNINKKLKNSIDRECAKLINNSQVICLFGLSLGETDKTWWKIIGQWLLSAQNKQIQRHLVIFIVKQWNSIHADEEIQNIEEIIGKFCLVADIPDDKITQIEDKIHIGFNTDMFKIDLVKPNITHNKDTIVKKVVIHKFTEA